jgi:hypothetical protein
VLSGGWDGFRGVVAFSARFCGVAIANARRAGEDAGGRGKSQSVGLRHSTPCVEAPSSNLTSAYK